MGPKADIPCCEWIGDGGSGHYVKMVHNGIEYGDMQLICEAYFLLKQALGLSNDELYDVFDAWNRTELESYLIEITRDIFSVKDPETGDWLVDKVLDTAQQKGTGKWMSQHALDLGVPTTLVTEAVFARCLSAQKEARVRASKVLTGPQTLFRGDRTAFIEDVRRALYVSKISSYAQGFVQLDAAARELGWKLNNGQIALLWRGGCIIRARFLEDIKKAFDKNAGAREPAAGRLFPQGHNRRAAELAPSGLYGRRAGAAGAGFFIGPELLRRLPPRSAAGQSSPGPARLLRRAHVPASR